MDYNIPNETSSPTTSDRDGSLLRAANVWQSELSSDAEMMQRLPAVLTPLDAAHQLLLDRVRPVDAIDAVLSDAIGCIAAANPPLGAAFPASNIATTDGWALRSADIAGASSYSPVMLAMPPVWVEAGDPLTDGCDCVLDRDMVEQTGSVFQVLAEVAPGYGVRRGGEDIAAGCAVTVSGGQVSARDTLVLRALKLEHIRIRSPRVVVVDVGSAEGDTASSQFVLEFVKTAGARATATSAKGRDAVNIVASLRELVCDLIITVGGTGSGRTDATIQALAECGTVLAHGLAIEPGRTAAVARIGTTPVIAIPGLPEDALAACLMLVQPALDVLLARSTRQKIFRPLARKISSPIGVTELVLLETRDDAWMPIASGRLSLDAILRGEAWLAVTGESEGYAAGTIVGAFSLRDIT